MDYLNQSPHLTLYVTLSFWQYKEKYCTSSKIQYFIEIAIGLVARAIGYPEKISAGNVESQGRNVQQRDVI